MRPRHARWYAGAARSVVPPGPRRVTARRVPRRLAAAAVAAVLGTALACGTGGGPAGPADPRSLPPGDPAQAALVERLARGAVPEHHLRSIIVRVTRDGTNVYTGAIGESMTGVPATPDMHYRNGAFAFTYISEIIAKMTDQKKVSLDDELARWMPELPNADRITVKNLLNMTSGYADYVYQPETLNGVNLDPFRQWTNAELIRIGVSVPMAFEPGTNWGYSHTNYVILADVAEKIAGRPMADVMQDYIIGPMGLRNTSGNADTPAVPDPVLHSFSSERRQAMQVPPAVPFYEESTFWNPSWTTAEGAVQTTDIYDQTTSMEIVGSGALVSPEAHQAQVGKNLVGFGHEDPTGRCPACTQMTEQRSYGLGVELIGSWIAQTKNFAGSGATSGYLPSQRLTVSVATTYTAAAFDGAGNYTNASSAIFTEIAAALAPNEAPPPS